MNQDSNLVVEGNVGLTSLRLTNEDLLLMKYLLESNFLTRAQIHKYIYFRRSLLYLNQQRLWKLMKQKFIKKGPVVSDNGTVLMADEMALESMFLYRRRLAELYRVERSKLFYVPPDMYSLQPKIDLRQFDHDYYLNMVRFEFENHGADYWISYKLLYRTRKFKMIPDGVFQKGNRLFAVELETTLKKPGRYEELFSSYYSSPEISLVLYIAGSNRIYKELARMFSPQFIKDSPEAFKKFLVIRLEDFLKGSLVFQNPAYFDFKIDLKKLLGG